MLCFSKKKKRMSVNFVHFFAVIATILFFQLFEHCRRQYTIQCYYYILRILSSIIQSDQYLEKISLKCCPLKYFIFHIFSDVYYKNILLALIYDILEIAGDKVSPFFFRTSTQIKGKIFQKNKDKEGISYFQNLHSFTLTMDIESYFHLLSHN